MINMGDMMARKLGTRETYSRMCVRFICTSVLFLSVMSVFVRKDCLAADADSSHEIGLANRRCAKMRLRAEKRGMVFPPGFRFVPIPPGTFLMGSPPTEKGRKDDETRHKVVLTKPFWMSVTEVTQRQYVEVMMENPSELPDVDRPVSHVTWKDAVAFCHELTTRERRHDRLADNEVYRLPTEAEWEYACRAGSTEAYCFGGDWRKLGDWAIYEENGGMAPGEVAKRKPNNWGLYDMHGNVSEWCLDWHDGETDYPKHDVVNPLINRREDGYMPLTRGGSSDANAWACRSASRTPIGPMFSDWFNTGIRVVRGAAVPVTPKELTKTDEDGPEVESDHETPE